MIHSHVMRCHATPLLPHCNPKIQKPNRSVEHFGRIQKPNNSAEDFGKFSRIRPPKWWVGLTRPPARLRAPCQTCCTAPTELWSLAPTLPVTGV